MIVEIDCMEHEYMRRTKTENLTAVVKSLTELGITSLNYLLDKVALNKKRSCWSTYLSG